MFKRKVYILTAILAIFLWFFPWVSKSLFAVPFFSIAPPFLGYIFSVGLAFCASYFFFRSKKKWLVVLIIVLIYFAVPKVADFSVGDIDSSNSNYCDCYGFEFGNGACCHSDVNYCIGFCLRNETTKHFSPYSPYGARMVAISNSAMSLIKGEEDINAVGIRNPLDENITVRLEFEPIKTTDDFPEIIVDLKEEEILGKGELIKPFKVKAPKVTGVSVYKIHVVSPEYDFPSQDFFVEVK